MKFTGKQSKQSVLKALMLFLLFVCLFSFASASYSDCTVYGNCPPLGLKIVSYIQNIFDDVYCKLTGCTIGNSTGNLSIGDSGNLVLNGDATQWDDMTIPLTSAKVGILNPPTLLLFRGTTYAYGFGNAGAGNEQDMIGTLQMSHSYKLNSLIRCHIHWACGTTSANNVTWGLEYTKASIGEVFPLPTTLRATGSCGTAYTHNLADFGNGGNFTGISGVMNLRVFRNSANATDNYNADDVYGLSLDCHYEKDSFGSNGEFIK